MITITITLMQTYVDEMAEKSQAVKYTHVKSSSSAPITVDNSVALIKHGISGRSLKHRISVQGTQRRNDCEIIFGYSYIYLPYCGFPNKHVKLFRQGGDKSSLRHYVSMVLFAMVYPKFLFGQYNIW